MTQQEQPLDNASLQMSYDLSKHTTHQISEIIKQHSLDLIENCEMDAEEAISVSLIPLISFIKAIGKSAKTQGINFPTIHRGLKEAIEELI